MIHKIRGVINLHQIASQEISLSQDLQEAYFVSSVNWKYSHIGDFFLDAAICNTCKK